MPGVTGAVIATDSPEAAAAGARIAREGGNAVDIAVAAALTATVSETLMCSLGGSGFVMSRIDGRAELFDGSDAIPGLAADPAAAPPSWRDVDLPYGGGIVVRAGHATVAVPGVLAGLELAWRTRGSLPWREVSTPAHEVARDGFEMGRTPARWLALAGDLLFKQHPPTRACFFRGDEAIQAGDHVVFPGMADTMEAIGREGGHVFYEGEIASAFAREMRDGGGLVTRADLAAYRAVDRAPLEIESRGFTLALNPPPAVGGAALGLIVGLLDGGWSPEMGGNGAARAGLHAGVQTHLLDFRDERAEAGPLDEAAARSMLETSSLKRRLAALKSPHTTHLSVATANGDLAAVTMSNGYGSGVTIPGTGIACNNSLGEPELNPGGFGAATPGARLSSNMAPTVAWHPDGRRVALGSPGASRITTALAQAWSRYALEGYTWEQAVAAPRLHVEAVDGGLRVQCEPGIDASLLEERFSIRRFDAPDMFFGAVQLAAREANGRLIVVADERRHGAVATVP